MLTSGKLNLLDFYLIRYKKHFDKHTIADNLTKDKMSILEYKHPTAVRLAHKAASLIRPRLKVPGS